jgi:hypothetical protein
MYPVAASDVNAGYVVVRGADRALWYRQVSHGVWTGWGSLGGVALTAPAVANDGAAVNVFLVGDDHAMWTRRLTSPWRDLGGQFISAPGAGSLEVFAVGWDGMIYSAPYG